MAMRINFHTVTQGNALPLLSLYVVTFACLIPDDALWIFLMAIPAFVWMSIRDLASYEIPDTATIIIAGLGMIHSWGASLPAHLLTGVMVTGGLWALGGVYYRRTSTEALGIGDAKLFGAGLVWLGPSQLPDLFLVASIGGIVAHMITKRDTTQGIPFGPFIAYAIFILSLIDPIFSVKAL